MKKKIERHAISAKLLILSLIAAYQIRQAVMIWGAPGIGKSQIVAQVAALLGIQLRDVRLTLLDAVDLRGLPMVTDGITVWAIPDFFATIDPGSQGILFLDEFPSARPEVQAACYGLLLDGKLGDWTMPKGWMVVAAGNRKEDKAFTFEMSSANANRLWHFDLEVSNEDWLEYAEDSDQGNFAQVVTSFIRFSPQALNDFDAGRLRNATPRMWEKISDLCKSLAHGTPAHVVSSLFHSALPQHIAQPFFSYWKMFHAIPLIRDIESHPETAELPGNMSARFAITAALASRVVYHKASPDEAKQLFIQHFKYVKRLSAELTRLYVTMILRQDPDSTIQETAAYIQYELATQHRTVRQSAA